jgi:nicotinamide riboside transporter PnuC
MRKEKNGWNAFFIVVYIMAGIGMLLQRYENWWHGAIVVVCSCMLFTFALIDLKEYFTKK